MTYNDYLLRYRDTNVCCNPNPAKYAHSAEECEFEGEPSPANIQFYTFDLKEDFNMHESAIGVQVFQQGNFLAQCRSQTDRLTPASIYVACFDGEDQLLFNNFGKDFGRAMFKHGSRRLPVGKYKIFVYPKWGRNFENSSLD